MLNVDAFFTDLYVEESTERPTRRVGKLELRYKLDLVFRMHKLILSPWICVQVRVYKNVIFLKNKKKIQKFKVGTCSNQPIRHPRKREREAQASVLNGILHVRVNFQLWSMVRTGQNTDRAWTQKMVYRLKHWLDSSYGEYWSRWLGIKWELEKEIQIHKKWKFSMCLINIT